MDEKMVDRQKFYTLFSQGKMDEVKKLTQDALDGGESPETILNQGLIPAMGQIGIRFKNGDIYMPEVLIATRAMHAGMAILKPLLIESSTTTTTKIVLGTVKGDLHDVGKMLVAMMLEMKSIIEALKAAGLSDSVKTIIGGAPVTEGFANKIGADGYAPDAASAVEKIRELLAL